MHVCHRRIGSRRRPAATSGAIEAVTRRSHGPARRRPRRAVAGSRSRGTSTAPRRPGGVSSTGRRAASCAARSRSHSTRATSATFDASVAAVEHRLAGEEPVDGHAVEAADQLAVVGPRLDAVGPAQLVQPRVGVDERRRDPAAAAGRVGAGRRSRSRKRGVDADLVAPAPTGAATGSRAARRAGGRRAGRATTSRGAAGRPASGTGRRGRRPAACPARGRRRRHTEVVGRARRATGTATACGGGSIGRRAITGLPGSTPE